jgi:hypothetical protein
MEWLGAAWIWVVGFVMSPLAYYLAVGIFCWWLLGTPFGIMVSRESDFDHVAKKEGKSQLSTGEKIFQYIMVAFLVSFSGLLGTGYYLTKRIKQRLRRS